MVLKITAGKYKNLLIPTLKTSHYKPSTSKLKAAIFSILSSGQFNFEWTIKNQNILDLFSGSGSLGFEALSRGAAHATFIDKNTTHLKSSKAFAQKLNSINSTSFLRMNAINLPKAKKQYNTVFMDPPYEQNLVTRAIKSLIASQWLKDKAIIIIEMEHNTELAIPNNIKLLKISEYSNNKLLILQYHML